MAPNWQSESGWLIGWRDLCTRVIGWLVGWLVIEVEQLFTMLEQWRSKHRNTWPPDIVQALKRARQYHAMWKQEGRPGPEHKVSVLRRQASRCVRASQRRHTALKREMKYRKIMDAELSDQCLFYRLIRDHQPPSPGTKAIMDGDILLTDPAEAADAWAGHYAKLATPAENPRWNRKFLDQWPLLLTWFNFNPGMDM